MAPPAGPIYLEEPKPKIGRNITGKNNNPKVILLDEPMAALDPIIVQDIQKFILKLQSYGCGVIITDHQVQNLFAICDRAYVIGEHTIIAEGKPKDILKSTKARELYFGSFDN